MSSTYGEILKLSIFGQSHGPAIGMTLDGVPAGLPVDLQELQTFLNRRAPGQNEYSTTRKEEDAPEFLSGIDGGQEMMQTLLIVLVVLFVMFTAVMIMLARFESDLDRVEEEEDDEKTDL